MGEGEGLCATGQGTLLERQGDTPGALPQLKQSSGLFFFFFNEDLRKIGRTSRLEADLRT